MDFLLITVGTIFCIAGMVLLVDEQIFSPLFIGLLLILTAICLIRYFPGKPNFIKQTILTNQYEFTGTTVKFDKIVKVEKEEIKYNWIFLKDETSYFVITQ